MMIATNSVQLLRRFAAFSGGVAPSLPRIASGIGESTRYGRQKAIPDRTTVWTFEKRIGEAGAKALFDGVSAQLLKKSVLHPPSSSPLVSTGRPAITLSGIRFEVAARSQPFKHYRQLTGEILSARCGHELQVTISSPKPTLIRTPFTQAATH